MKVVDPGHYYTVRNFDSKCKEEQVILFVKRMGSKYPGNNSAYSGTITQELLRVILNRLYYVNNQIWSPFTFCCIQLIKISIWLLECRAALKKGLFIPSIKESIYGIICYKCGHVKCRHNG